MIIIKTYMCIIPRPLPRYVLNYPSRIYLVSTLFYSFLFFFSVSDPSNVRINRKYGVISCEMYCFQAFHFRIHRKKNDYVTKNLHNLRVHFTV